MITGISLGITLNRGTRAHLIVGDEAYTCRICSIKNWRYFVHIGHNSMVSDPKRATPWWDPVLYISRIVINLVLDPKMKSPLAPSNTGMIFSVHDDYI